MFSTALLFVGLISTSWDDPGKKIPEPAFIQTHPCLLPTHGILPGSSPLSPPTLTRTLVQEWCWKTGRWEMVRSVLPTLNLSHLVALAKTVPFVRRCRFYIMVMHVCVDMRDVFTWTRNCVIWWRALLIPGQPPLPAHRRLRPGTKQLSWDYAKKRVLDFILSTSKSNISIYLLYGPDALMIEAWVGASLLYSRVGAQPCGHQNLVPFPLRLFKPWQNFQTIMS